MKIIIIILTLSAICFAANFDTTTTEKVIVTVKYEMSYKEIVVDAKVWRQIGNQWYVLAKSGNEYWSDKFVRKVSGSIQEGEKK